MEMNRKAVGLRFCQALEKSLIKKYGRIPTAAKFADSFNLRAHGTTTISRETARKWLRGLVLPEVSRLNVLTSWLCLKSADFKWQASHFESFLCQATQRHEGAAYADALRRLALRLPVEPYLKWLDLQ